MAPLSIAAVKTDLAVVFRSSKGEQLPDSLEEIYHRNIVAFERALQFERFRRQCAMGGDKIAKLYEGTNDGHRARTPQNAGEHGHRCSLKTRAGLRTPP
jgi:hypothetical protein